VTNQQILEKAIQKAIDGGWSYGRITDLAVIIHNGKVSFIPRNDVPSIEKIIYSHDFAKALWGEEPMRAYQWHRTISREGEDLIESGGKHNWQYHLQQMVIAPDSIKYLGEHL
jgi:hypothetical protein